MFGNRVGSQVHRLCTVTAQEVSDEQLGETAAQQMLMIPLWKATEDIVYLICIPLRGEQAKCGCSLTHVLTADFRQYRFLTPPCELDRQDPVVELFPSRHSPLSRIIVAAHREPGPQHHVKSGVPQALGSLNVCGNSLIKLVRELLNRSAVHASEEAWIRLHLWFAPNGQ